MLDICIDELTGDVVKGDAVNVGPVLVQSRFERVFVPRCKENSQWERRVLGTSHEELNDVGNVRRGIRGVLVQTVDDDHYGRLRAFKLNRTEWHLNEPLRGLLYTTAPARKSVCCGDDMRAQCGLVLGQLICQ